VAIIRRALNPHTCVTRGSARNFDAAYNLSAYRPDLDHLEDYRAAARCGTGRKGVGAFLLLSILTRQETVGESGVVPGELRRV
jgi:hypothetical protein